MNDIILLHGALGSQDQLLPLKQKLAGDFRCHTFNFRAHGSQGSDVKFTMRDLADDLEDYINSNKLKNPVVFGYSMGGYAALTSLSQGFTNIAGVVTLATKFNWTTEAVTKEVALLDPETIEIKVPQYAESLRNLHGSKWRHLLINTGGIMCDIVTCQYLNEVSSKKIQIPVLCMVGDNDKMVSIEETNSMCSFIPMADMVVLPHTSHPIIKADVELLSLHIKHFALRKAIHTLG